MLEVGNVFRPLELYLVYRNLSSVNPFIALQATPIPQLSPSVFVHYALWRLYHVICCADHMLLRLFDCIFVHFPPF